MRCSSCGATIKEGASVCPVCGEEILGGFDYGFSKKNPFAIPGAEPSNDSTRQKCTLGTLETMYNLKLVIFILMLVGLAATFAMLFAVEGYINGGMKDDESFESTINVLQWVVRGFGLAQAILMAKILVEIFHLADFDPTFRRATYYGIVFVVLYMIGIFVDSALLDLVDGVVGILYIKNFCEGMYSLCTPGCDDAYDRWRRYWTVYVIAIVSSIVFALVCMIKLAAIVNDSATTQFLYTLDGEPYGETTNLESAKALLRWTYGYIVGAAVLSAVPAVLELIALKSTKKSIEEL